jgi:hypothetical protein
MLACAEATARFREIGWVPDYLDDLDADLLRFYGIDGIDGLPGPRFFALAERVAAYGGVMTARAEQHRQAAGAAPQRPAARDAVDVADAADLARDSRFAGIFSTTRVVARG